MVKNFSKISLSIVVPVFNEEEGIEKTIIEIFKDLKSKSIKDLLNTYEVVVVNDGSWDGTGGILRRLEKRYRSIKTITHINNQGLGASIMTGIENSTKEYVTYLPADGQAFLREISEGLRLVHLADLILTYRGKREDYSSYRHILSNTLTLSMRILFGLNFKDYNWVHIYRRDLFNSIHVKSNGVLYLAEVVVRTHKRDFSILEAQAKYHPRSTGYSKNANLKNVVRSLIDLIRLWVDINFKSHSG